MCKSDCNLDWPWAVCAFTKYVLSVNCWRLREITGDYWRLLEIAGDYWMITNCAWNINTTKSSNIRQSIRQQVIT